MSVLLPQRKTAPNAKGERESIDVEAYPSNQNPTANRTTQPSSPQCISKVQFALALAVGASADGLQVLTLGLPIITWIIDIATACIFFGIFGFRKAMILPIAIELIPGLSLTPTWTLAAILLYSSANKPS